MNESPIVSLSPIAASAEIKAMTNEAIAGKPAREHVAGRWSTDDAMTMSASVLVFGLILLLALAYHMKKNTISDHESRLYIIVIVIVSALFLVVAGYSDSQIAPVMGLLGTIVGYVLHGIADPKKDQNDDQPAVDTTKVNQ